MIMEKDQEFVEYVARAIVNHPDDVSTERIVDERGVLITLHINQEDMGYVIGRSGQTARAMRTLLKIVGAKNDARVNLKIYEPEDARRSHDERRAVTAPAPAAAAPAPASRPMGNHGDLDQASQADDDDIDTSVVDNLTF